MEKSTFNKKLEQPLSYTLQEKLEIQNAKTHFPYCAILQQMDLLSDKAASIYQWEERFLSRVALHLPQPGKMIGLLPQVETIEISTPDDLKLKQQIEEGKRKEYVAEELDAFDVMNEINSFQDVSLKTAPKSEILSKFLEVSNCKPEDLGVADGSPVEEIAKKSIDASNSIVTETMAVVLEKQGKFAKAIEVYEKLIIKNPEKSSTFANRIDELKARL